jgi:hypothetical protein
VAGARILVVGTNVATTGDDGRYLLCSVAAGTVELQVLRVGFATQKKPVTVSSSGAVTVDFDLAQSVVTLGEVVTNATGGSS